jgi:hypothetical protein
MTKFLKVFLDSDLVAGLLLLFIAFITYMGTGDDFIDWVFPLMTSYTLFIISSIFLIKSLFKIVRCSTNSDLKVDISNIPSIMNVVFFSIFLFCYLFALYAFGFWIASPLLLWLIISFFTAEKNFSSMRKALVISIITCIIAYIVFTHIFYVPFPESRIFG